MGSTQVPRWGGRGEYSGFLHCAYMKKPLGAASCKFLIFGSPGRARTADLVINSHPLYRLSYRGMTGRPSYWMGCAVVNVTHGQQLSFVQQLIGLPSHRVWLVRGLPVFARQITRGLAYPCLSQKVNELFVPGLLPSGW